MLTGQRTADKSHSSRALKRGRVCRSRYEENFFYVNDTVRSGPVHCARPAKVSTALLSQSSLMRWRTCHDLEGARPSYSRTTVDCATCSQARGVPLQCPPTRGAFPPTDTAPLSYLVSVASVSMNRATSSRATEPPRPLGQVQLCRSVAVPAGLTRHVRAARAPSAPARALAGQDRRDRPDRKDRPARTTILRLHLRTMATAWRRRGF